MVISNANCFVKDRSYEKKEWYVHNQLLKRKTREVAMEMVRSMSAAL